MKNAFIYEQETKKALANFILSSNRLSMDINCFDFEVQFSMKQGRKEGILFNSGGSANLAMIQSLKNIGKLKNGDKVGFSALTWATNTMPIIQMGLIPVPIDCEVETLNIMSSNLEDRIKEENLSALFLTNALGFVGDIEKIIETCKNHNILLFEDNCESLGTITQTGIKTGNFGIAASFSFFVAHHISTIEGGMICTDDEELAEMLRIVRANGWDRNLTAIQQSKWRKTYNITNEFDAKYIFYDLGFNFRPTEITGFLGLFQLQFLEETINKRETNYLIIEPFIKNNIDLIFLRHNHIKILSTFAIPIVCKTPELRTKYLNQFSGAGIEIRPLISGNIQRQPFYSKYIKKKYPLPNTDFLHDNSFYCGNYPELSNSDIEVIKSCIIN